MPHAALIPSPPPSGPPSTHRARPRLAPLALAAALSVATAGSTAAESASINASVHVLAIRVELALSTGAARVGDKVKATATISNDGPARLSGITVELRADTAGLRVQGSSSNVVVRVQPGRTATASWTLCAVQPGNYLVLASATLDGVSIDSPARLLSVSGERRRGCA